MKMKFSANKIYYNFSQENPKSANIQNPHRPYRHFKKKDPILKYALTI